MYEMKKKQSTAAKVGKQKFCNAKICKCKSPCTLPEAFAHTSIALFFHSWLIDCAAEPYSSAASAEFLLPF